MIACHAVCVCRPFRLFFVRWLWTGTGSHVWEFITIILLAP